METHRDQILYQFTRQASLFQSTHRSAEEAIENALTVSAVTAEDTVLDVACGPGVLACAFARRAKHVTGIDITPAMLQQARALQATSSVTNVAWELSDVSPLPYEDGSFSMVITRYSFHHFREPADVLREMVRVCRAGGAVVVIDSAPPGAKSAAFNRAERMRDPSHTKALTREELLGLMEAAGLNIARTHLYAWEVSVESLLARSFPADGDRSKLASIYEDDVGTDALAMNARTLDGQLHVTFPTLIAVGHKRAS